MFTVGEWASVISVFTGMATVAAWILNYAIVQPLRSTIENLDASVSDLKVLVNIVSDKQNDILQRLAVNETSTKSAHHRANRIEDRLDHLEEAIHR